MFIKCASKEDRIKLIEFLEAEGYYCVENRSYSREKTIESRLPLVVDPNRKSIYHMGNVTCAAAAAHSGAIMSDKDFFFYCTHLTEYRRATSPPKDTASNNNCSRGICEDNRRNRVRVNVTDGGFASVVNCI